MWWALLEGAEPVGQLATIGIDRTPPEDQRLRRIVDVLRSLRLLGMDVTAGELAVALATANVPGGIYRGQPITDLNQTISATYQQSEVQAISDKLDAVLAELRSMKALQE